MKQNSSYIVALALLLATGGVNLKATAENPVGNFTMPKTLESGTKIQIEGSSSLSGVNQNLKERFQKQFPGTEVAVPSKYEGSDAGVKAIVEDKTDLAGMGRPLTKEEKAKGLDSKTIGRAKIAIIVSKDNPYTGNLTLNDFAKIYRGEVTDWSQLPSANGAKGKIKVIDRPDTSDTKRAFANYPVFQNGKLKTGKNAEKVSEDSTQAVVAKLGADGIGYAPVDQIKNIPDIRAVTLHSTQPDNPKYPFSQPLVYAYKNKDGKVREGAKAFLGYVSDPTGQAAVGESIGAGTATDTTPATPAATTPVPGAAPAPTSEVGPGTPATGVATTTDTSVKGGFPSWPLLLIPAIGGLLWWKTRKKSTDEVSSIVTPETNTGLKPLYPPSPSRTVVGDVASSDLSSDLSGFRPSGTVPVSLANPPTIVPPTVPNLDLNGVVEPVKSTGIDLPGAGLLAGGVAAAAAGKTILDRTNEADEKAITPEIKTPEIDFSDPLEGVKDKSSNLGSNLDIRNPLEGLKDKAGDVLQGGTVAGAAALAGGAALASGAGESIGNFVSGAEAAELPEGIKLDKPNITNPLEGIQDKVADLTPDVEITNPSEGIQDNKVTDFFKGGGAAIGAAGVAAVVGGAALASDALGSKTSDDSLSDVLWPEDVNDGSIDSFLEIPKLESPELGLPELETPKLDTPELDLADLESFDSFLDAPELETPKLDTLELDLADLESFDSFLDADAPKLDSMEDPFGISDDLDLDTDLFADPSTLKANSPFGELDNKTDDLFKMGAVAGVTGAAVGGAALFDAAKQPEMPDDLELPNLETSTFDRDLAAISQEELDDDPFAGLSDLLGEETGDLSPGLQDKASDLFADGRGFGAAALGGGAAAVAGASQTVQSFFQREKPPAVEPVDEASTSIYSEGHITLSSLNPSHIYAHWEVPLRLKQQLKEQGGQKLSVRLYDIASSEDLTAELPIAFKEFECDDLASELQMPIDNSEHHYIAEVGYKTDDGRWLMLARSSPLAVLAS